MDQLGTRADKYTSFLNWLVNFRNPFGENGHFSLGLYGEGQWEPTYFSNEWEFYIIATLTFIHAYRHGSRYIWLWMSILCHGFTVELVSYWVEPIDNFWHGQSSLMFFGQREPLHIVLVYPAYLYIAAIATSRLRMTEYSEACALGLLVIVLDVPYDVMGIKLLWWTWHDTDANIRDRHYWVPWTSYYFHMTFACSFSLIYNKARRYFTGVSGLLSTSEIAKLPYSRQIKMKNFAGEFKALLCAGLFSMPTGILQFVPGYHLGADVFGIHAQFTTEFLAFIYGCVVLYGILRAQPRNLREEGEREESRRNKKGGKGSWHYDEVYIAMLVHFIHYMCLVLLAEPQTFQVLGLHQPMGSPPGATDGYSCSQTRNVTYPYPFTEGFRQFPFSEALPDILSSNLLKNVTVWKRPYLCPNEELLDEGTFGYSCANAKAQQWVPGQDFFYICGTDWTNKGTGTTWWEYFFLIFGACIIGMNIFHLILCYPYTLYDHIFRFKELPKYFLTDSPSTYIDSVNEVRINSVTGKQEFHVTRHKGNGNKLASNWEERECLEQDGVGEVYGERNGHYGLNYDAYGGSTRARLKMYLQRDYALQRLAMYESRRQDEKNIGIIYTTAGLAAPAVETKKNN